MEQTELCEKPLSDRSDMISEVQKCSKIQTFQGSAQDPAGGAYSAPPDSLVDGEGLAAPFQEPHCRSLPFGHRFYGSQGLTHYRVGNRTNDRFQTYAYMKFVFRFRRLDTMGLSDEGADECSEISCNVK